MISEAPNTTEKRSLVNIRAMQESLKPEQYHWVPTGLMVADGLTKLDPKLRLEFLTWLQDPRAVLSDQGVKDQRKTTNDKSTLAISGTSVDPSPAGL